MGRCQAPLCHIQGSTGLRAIPTALKLSRPQIGQMAQTGARRVAGSIGAHKTQQALIAGQIALTLLLLAGAGTAIDGFTRMLRTPLGYDPHNVMSIGVPIQITSYNTWAARAAYYEQLRSSIAQTPGVTMAAVATASTPPHNGWPMRFEILGKGAMDQQMAQVGMVGSDYFLTLRIALLQGRTWDATEDHRGALLAVVNRTMAQRYFPAGDAIGRSIKIPGFEDRGLVEMSVPKLSESWLMIVGIVEDVKNDGLRNPVKPAIYIPYTLHLLPGTQMLVRSQTSPLALLRSVRLQMSAVNPDQQIYGIVTDLETWISDEPEWQQGHLVSWIFGGFAGLALALAAVGLYSVVSYTVAQRTSEFGIRMALGARRGHVMRIVFQSALVSVGGGVVAGLALTFALNSVIARWAQGNAHDPAILFEGILVLLMSAAFACALPAFRASRVEPMTALRCE